MPIILPARPAPRQMNPRPITFGSEMKPVLGGNVSRLARLGSRWAVDVELPPMPYDAAMAWLSAVARAETETVVMPFRQHGFDVGLPGLPLVDGGGQLGKFLALKSVQASYPATDGQFFSILTGGQRFLHLIAGNVMASPAGEVLLPIHPMLRRPPDDGDVVEIANPMIEGFVEKGAGWSVDLAQTVGLSFTITERE